MTAYRQCPRLRACGTMACGLLGILFLADARLSGQATFVGQAADPGLAAPGSRATLGTPTTGILEPAQTTRSTGPRALSGYYPRRPAGGTGWQKNGTDQLLSPTAAQEPLGPVPDKERQPFPPQIRLELPGPQVLFRLESEQALQERLRQEARQREPGKKIIFPEMPAGPLEKAPVPRDWPFMAEVVEPNYAAFRRLYFQQINSERYGWDLGYFHPLVATGTFYFDVLTLPLQMVADPCRRYDYNTGWGLPGDPVPFLLYPPQPK